LLFCLGNTSLLNGKTMAIVGSRNASANGLRFAYKIAKDLAEAKYVIVSGFARGIDNAAHKASVDYATIAVLAGGVDHIYPPEQEDLYYEIAEKGLVVAELPLGAIPKPQNFPQRNRIISGTSMGVAVIEASLKSGSLITAKYAIQQNREVFAVPGFPLDPRYQGNNSLLKQGAYLLEDVEDILNVTQNSLIRISSLQEQRKQFRENSKSSLKVDFSEKEVDHIVSVLEASGADAQERQSNRDMTKNLSKAIRDKQKEIPSQLHKNQKIKINAFNTVHSLKPFSKVWVFFII
jgi:DNA protecting protein DprA